MWIPSKSQVLAALFILVYVVIGYLCSGCSPVKRVLADPEKFEKVAQEVVKRGYCINDTVTEVIVKDTTIISYVPVIKEIRLPAVIPSTLDTLIDNTHVAVKDGTMVITTPGQLQQQIKVIEKTNSIRDLRLESILKLENEKLTTDLALSELEVKRYEAQIASIQIKYDRRNILFGCALLGVILLTLYILTHSVKTAVFR